MRTSCLSLILAVLFSAPLFAQPTPRRPTPDVGVLLCWNNDAEQALGHERTLLTAVGRVVSLDGTTRTIGIRSEKCSEKMPDATCFGVPGGLMCRLSGIERIVQAAAWIAHRYQTLSPTNYESFWRADREYVGHAFRYADGVETDAGADRLRMSNSAGNSSPELLLEQLVEYNLAAILGHELSHAHDENCPIASKSFVEESGLFSAIVRDDLSGSMFAKHSPSPDEVVADRCGMRYVRAFTDYLKTKYGTQKDQYTQILKRASSDMLAFQMTLGWRKFEQLPPGKYGFFSLDAYLYAPYRAILFSSEVHDSAGNPTICGGSAEIIVQSIQTTYKKYEGAGKISDQILALFPSGVESSWNGKPWTVDSFTCNRAQ